jgi:hypothetical protein
MDAVTTAQLMPVLTSLLNGVMGGVGGQLWESLTHLVRRRRDEQPRLTAAMEAVASRPADQAAVAALAAALEEAARADPGFAGQLRDWYAPAARAVSRTVVNSNSGTVTGPLIQAGEIHGGITFGAPPADGAP